jgi:hypothetical protein
MPKAFDRLGDLLAALDEESVRYALFGGQAVNLHGIPRFTEAIDLFVDPTTDNVERLHRASSGSGMIPRSMRSPPPIWPVTTPSYTMIHNRFFSDRPPRTRVDTPGARR